MKHSTKASTGKTVAAFFMAIVFRAIAFAQDSTVSSTHTTTVTEEHSWYTQPWVWFVGGAILLFLIIALVRGSSSGNSRTNKVTYTKTTETDKT